MPTRSKTEFKYAGHEPAKYMVVNPYGNTPPKREHPTYKAAHQAAAKMATKHPGEYFYIVKIKACFQIQQEPLMTIFG